MSKVRKLFDKYFKPLYLVGAFLVLLLIAFAAESRAGEVSMEVGAGFLSSRPGGGAAVVLTETWNERYSLSVGWFDKQVCKCRFDTTPVDENIFIQAMREARLGKFDFGLGMSYWQNTSRVFGRNMNYAIMIEYNVTPRFSARLRHWSNAGSAAPNLGQDFLSLAYKF